MSVTDLFGESRRRKKRPPAGPLVPVDLHHGCPACGHPLERESSSQPALIRHGGYGETTVTTTAHCPSCTWSMTVSVDACRP